jgi:5'-AMP-activated protein kinase, regulatory gamma subunit
MLQSRARRIPLVDIDDETQRPMVVSVITQYRILKFISTNVQATQLLRKPLKDLQTVGTYTNLQSVSMNTPVIDVIHLLVKHNISSVPIVNSDSKFLQCLFMSRSLISRLDVLINVFESVDVIALIQGGGDYENLQLTVGEALLKRSDVRSLSNHIIYPVYPMLTTFLQEFAGIHTCSLYDRLSAIFDTIRKSRVHRFIVVDSKGRVQGVLTLSDILDYVLLEGEPEGDDSGVPPSGLTG